VISGVTPEEVDEGVAALCTLLPPVVGPVAETVTTGPAWTMTGWAHQVDGQLDLARSLSDAPSTSTPRTARLH
jgi:hypothetical protein